jgi:hypothetical protein
VSYKVERHIPHIHSDCREVFIPVGRDLFDVPSCSSVIRASVVGLCLSP